MGEQQAVRWRRIVSEAAEQSGRSVLPQVHPLMSLPEACQQHASGLALIPYENERECSLRGVLHGADGVGPSRCLLALKAGGTLTRWPWPTPMMSCPYHWGSVS